MHYSIIIIERNVAHDACSTLVVPVVLVVVSSCKSGGRGCFFSAVDETSSPL